MISHKHKFIFRHIPKCGGTSVEEGFNWKGECRHYTMEYYKKENSNHYEYH